MKRYEKLQTGYHNLIGTTAELVDSLEACVQVSAVRYDFASGGSSPCHFFSPKRDARKCCSPEQSSAACGTLEFILIAAYALTYETQSRHRTWVFLAQICLLTMLMLVLSEL